MSTSFTFRPLTDDDAAQSSLIGQIAFGMAADRTAAPSSPVEEGRSSVAAFDGDVLAGRIMDWHFGSWFGGAVLPTSGIAGVTIAPEYRGRKLLRPLFDRIFEGALERGALISGLYPSAAGIYRGLGYEHAGGLDEVRLPTEALTGVRAAGSGVTTRRATLADRPATEAIYDAWAAAHTVALDRRVPAFTQSDQEWQTEYDGISVAERDGVIIGYAGWNRGPGDASATLKVSDLIATDVDGYRALLALFGSFASTIPQTIIETGGGDDIVRVLLRTADWPIVARHAYMIKILDVPGALAARSYPTWVRVRLPFSVGGDVISANNGDRTLIIEDGRAAVEPGGTNGPAFSPNGLAALFAGAQTCADLRTVGLLTGPTADDPSWDLLFGGQRPQIRDTY